MESNLKFLYNTGCSLPQRWLLFAQAFLAFYVINDLQMAQSSKALVPAIIYICSFIVSLILQEIKWTGLRLKVVYSAGGVIWIFCGAGILFLMRSMNAFMYIISIFIGVANALMTVTGVSMQSVLVGEDLHGCAFVYGSLSFLDKVSCGIALFILESYQSSSPDLQGCHSIISCFSITRTGLGLVPAICALAGVGDYIHHETSPHCTKASDGAPIGIVCHYVSGWVIRLQAFPHIPKKRIV
ncbi:hypothetical protein L1049_011141 [Liquidambar formosana]|uniref:Uncharacterized protein n=1 Tax=Liquidambar formosana TaxID=63359 RepID=A0AAP0RW75_LIQFO